MTAQPSARRALLVIAWVAVGLLVAAELLALIGLLAPGLIVLAPLVVGACVVLAHHTGRDATAPQR